MFCRAGLTWLSDPFTHHTEGDREQFGVYVLPPYPSSEGIVSVDMPSLKEADLYFMEHCTDIEIRSSACVSGLMTRCGRWHRAWVIWLVFDSSILCLFPFAPIAQSRSVQSHPNPLTFLIIQTTLTMKTTANTTPIPIPSPLPIPSHHTILLHPTSLLFTAKDWKRRSRKETTTTVIRRNQQRTPAQPYHSTRLFLYCNGCC